MKQYKLAKFYLKSISLSAAGKITMLASSIIVMWQLNTILGKDMFGAFMIVFSLYQLIAFTIAGKFQSLVLYHGSNHKNNTHDEPITAEITKSAFGHMLITSAFSAVILAHLANPLAGLFNKTELIPIFSTMAAFIPAFTLNTFITSHYRANQDVGKQAIYTEIAPSILRIILLWTVTATSIEISDKIILVSAAFIASFFVPALSLYIERPIPINFKISTYTLWDLKHGLSTSMGQLLMRSNQNLLVVISGALASNALTADFAIASRFMQLLLLPQNAIAQILMPRLRAHMKQKQTQQLRQEFGTMQNISLVGTLLGAAGFLLLAQYALPLFGDYGENAFTLLIILSLSAIILTAFGDISNYSAIAGHSDLALFAHAAGFLTLLLGAYALTPQLGSIGLAYATSLSTLCSCIALCYVIKAKEKHTAISWQEIAAIITAAITIITFVQYALLSQYHAALIMISIALLYAFNRIKQIKQTFALIKS